MLEEILSSPGAEGGVAVTTALSSSAMTFSSFGTGINTMQEI